MTSAWRVRARLACVVALAGCASGVVSEPAQSPPLDAPADMAPDFVAVTHSPDWKVSIAGKRVMLLGPQGTRELALQSNDVLFDGRNVVATDALGRVEVRVTPRLCQDVTSGAWLPYTARVTVDRGQPVLGCARDP